MHRPSSVRVLWTPMPSAGNAFQAYPMGATLSAASLPPKEPTWEDLLGRR